MIYAIIQAVIISAVVAFSLWQVARKIMPKTVLALQVKGSQALNRADMPMVVQAVGKSLQPSTAPATGCGSGCDTCKACASFKKV